MKRILWVLGLSGPIGLLAAWGLSFFPEVVETLYGRAWYRFWSEVMSFLFGWLPISLGEFITYAGIGAVLTGLGFWIRSLVFFKNQLRKKILRGLVSFGVVGSSILSSFLLLWGLNYSRPGLAQTLKFSTPEMTPGVLASLCQWTLEGALISRWSFGTPDKELQAFPPDLIRQTPSLFSELPPELRHLSWESREPKPLTFSGIFSLLGISGVYFPWTAEANYNQEVPFFRLPGIWAHELAHQHGIAREDEANFMAILTCVHHPNPRFRYSGWLLGFSYAFGALKTSNPTLAREFWKTIPIGVKKDFEYERRFWDARKGLAQELGQQVNDLYLKANGQKGVVSYDGVVTLLAAGFLQRKDLLE